METEKKKVTEIVINGKLHTWDKKDRISYDEVVGLAYGQSNPGMVYTITYRRAHGDKDGVLSLGEVLKVKDGMEFVVEHTTKS